MSDKLRYYKIFLRYYVPNWWKSLWFARQHPVDTRRLITRFILRPNDQEFYQFK